MFANSLNTMFHKLIEIFAILDILGIIWTAEKSSILEICQN